MDVAEHISKGVTAEKEWLTREITKRVPAHNTVASVLTLNLSFGILVPHGDGPNRILHYSWQPAPLILVANGALCARETPETQISFIYI